MDKDFGTPGSRIRLTDRHPHVVGINPLASTHA
jgi:hypothetical protein